MALVVKIRGDATHFEKTMAKVKAIGGQVGGIVTSIGKGAAIAAAGITAMAAGGALLGLHLAKVAEEGQAAEQRLENIVKQMGLFGSGASKVSARLGELADATALQTGIDDDAILATQAKLATFKELAKTAGTLGGAFDRATQAAIDMQSAGFGQAEQNAVQLGKALNDPVKGLTALARSGITFTEAEKGKVAALVQSNQMLKAQEMILAAIEKQVGGTAAATAKGTGRMNVAISQITEKLGGPFASAVSGFADGFISQMPRMVSAIDGISAPITAKIEDMGRKVGNNFAMTLSQTIQGDMTMIAATGAAIGEALKQGVLYSWTKAGNSIGKFMIEGIVDSLSGTGPEKARQLSEPITGKMPSFQEWMTDAAQSGDLGDKLEAIRTEIEAMNSGGNIDASKQTLEVMRRIEQLIKQGAFNKQPAQFSR